MIFTLLLFFLTYILFQIRLSILSELLFLSRPLHESCLNLLPTNPATQATLQALVCGHNFESFKDQYLYTSSGLIHLFVVSGSHLILIYKSVDFILKKTNLNILRKYILIFIFFYATVCLFNPPVVRSLIGLFFFDILKIQKKYWPNDYVLLLVGLFCLMMSPLWVTSLSLQMSWLAALALELNRRYFKRLTPLLQQIPFYVLYTLTFSALGFPQVSVIVISLLFTPVLEFILLPLAFLVLIFPFFDSVFATALNILNFTLSHLELVTSSITTPFENSIALNWILIFLIHFFLYFNQIKT